MADDETVSSATVGGSAVLYEASAPMFRNRPFSFVLSILVIPAFGVGIVILLFWYVKAKSRNLLVTGSELRYTVGILSKRRSELRLSTRRSVRVDQSLMQRMFGTGNISVFTAGDSPEVVAVGMPDPLRLRKLLLPDA
jgi:uncharacterized membrane protein YdbT with pleckstrin-like domain